MPSALLNLAKWPFYSLALPLHRRKSPRSPPPNFPRTAAIVVSWRRPFNMPQVLYGLNKQAFVNDIFVWHNRPSSFTYPNAFHWQSDRNLGCAVRHFLALGLSEFDYFLFIDDDLYLSFDFTDTFRLGIERYGQKSVLGFFGRNLCRQDLVNTYSKGVDLDSADSFLPTDIVKGRCHLASWETLSLLAHSRPDAPTREDMHDDIRLNLVAQQSNQVPSYLLPHHGKLVNLADPFSYWRRPGHLERRDKSLARAFAQGFQPPLWEQEKSA